MSHAPQLLMPYERWPALPTRTSGPFFPKPDIAAEITTEAMKRHAERCRQSIETLRARLEAFAPDTIVILGDDQHENILDDNMPPFVLYTGDKVSATRHFLYLGERAEDQMTDYDCDQPMAEHILDHLMESGFDPAWSRKTRLDTGLGHAFGRVLAFLMPEPRCRIVPLMVNTYFPPAPSAARCHALGKALRGAVETMPGEGRVVFIASGGLSHTKIDEALDRTVIAALETNDHAVLAGLSDACLMEGTSEIRNWISVAGAMDGPAELIDYVPCYRNADGIGCAMGFAVWNGN